MTEHPAPQADHYSGGVLSHAIPTELERLRLLEGALDPITLGVLADRAEGLPENARCLELGAGAGSVGRWLAGRFPAGRVTVVDIDTRFLDAEGLPNLELREEDVRLIDLPEASFDLIHARALFMHLPEREQLVKKAASWLAPGGRLVIEDKALFPFDSSPHPAWRKVALAVKALIESQGADLDWARRRQPAVLVDAGLTDPGLAVKVFTVGDGGAAEQYWRAFLAQLGPVLAGKGLVTAEDVDAVLTLFDDPSFVDASDAFISAWARRPPA